MSKMVIVSGATKGLGLAISKQLVENGYVVVGVSRTNSKEFSELMSNYSGSVFFYVFDFFDTDKISALVKDIVKMHGRPYALINNAALGHDGVLATMHEKDIHDLIKVNIEAPILLTKYSSRSIELLHLCGIKVKKIKDTHIVHCRAALATMCTARARGRLRCSGV